MFSAVIQIARRVLYPKWECFRQSSAWICISVKHIDHCAAHSLSAQVGFQHGFYFSEPRHFYRSTVVKHNNGVRLCFRHRFNQCVLAFAAASTAFAANASSALSSTSSKPLANVMFSFFTVARNSTASIADSVLKLLMWELPPP